MEKCAHYVQCLKKKEYCVTPVLEADISEGLFAKSTPDSIFISVISVRSFAHISWSQIPFSCSAPPPPTYLKASLMTRIVYFYCFWDFHSYL